MDQKDLKQVALIDDLVILYNANLHLAWQPLAGYIHCEDPTFCASPYSKGLKRVLESVYEV